MKTYEEYQDVDQPWLTRIPGHWSCYRGKRLFDNPKEKNAGNQEQNVLSLTLRGVIRNDKENPIGLAPADYSTYQIFERDDLVFKLIDLENISTSRVGIVPERGIMSSAYIRLSAREDVNIRYFYLQYYDLWLRQVFNGLGAGVRQTLNASDLLDIKIALPPRPEQDQIVRYLDWKVSCINRLIHGYQRQIELCRERKRLLVSQAILGGLSEHKTTQDSGIKWIGEIPCDWETIRCKNLFTETNERSTNGTETHLSMSQKLGLVPDDVMTERRMLSESYAGGKICYKNDLVLNRLKAHLGIFALAKQKGVISPDYTVFKINTELILPEYAEMVLKSDACRGELVKRVRGITVGFWRLYTENFNTIVLPVPSIDEQEAIMNHLNGLFSKIDSTIDMLEKEIALLREYRTRLISDVVTGQIDVRDEVIPDYTPETDTEDVDEDAATAESEAD